MLTDKVQELIALAKQNAREEGQETLQPESLLAAAGQHAEARVLLARCLDTPVDSLRRELPALSTGMAWVQEPMPLSKGVQDLLSKAKALAQEVPDQLHPGYISLRHLVCAIALSRPLCEQLDLRPVSQRRVVEQLTAWYGDDRLAPELGDLIEDVRTLRDDLLDKVFGQDHAVHAFVEGLFNAEVIGQADHSRKRPRAIFVFAGPPGVGKTFLSELSAEALGRPFKRFDMSSYSDHQSHVDLVGYAPSYKGAQPGLLTGFVAEHPDAFLLFDEIEKAHLNVIQLFLQILDAGRLEDKYTAEEVAFRDTTIIFTTNAGISLYDKPNESGVTTSNSTFHRRTILDALRTEKGPGGQPAFPPPICSRLATGYPVLFNHLGVNELNRIARAELQRVANLIEQQYFKSVVIPESLPMLLVLREGANVDARTVRAQSGIFLRAELRKFAELYQRRRLAEVLESVDTIRFELDTEDKEYAEVVDLFEPADKPVVLLVASPYLAEVYTKNVEQVKWLTASNTQEALEHLSKTDVDMVLLDIWIGRDVETFAGSFAGTISQFDHAPAAASALSEGQECLQAVRQRLPQMPVFLLSLIESGQEEGSVDEELFLACVRSGGARGLLTSAFTNDMVTGWEQMRDRFVDTLRDTALRMYREERSRELGQQRKVLAFDTAPRVDRMHRQVLLRVRNLRLSRAVAAEDAGELLDEVERPSTRFDDVFGADAAKEALNFIVEWMQNPRGYAAMGVKPPKGILLTGPPGTGKTMLARALAGESNVAFLVASGTNFVTIWQGSGPQNVRDLFARARRNAPSILFIDEIDAIGKARTGAAGGGRAEESTLNALLTEIDGFGGPTTRPVILLSATNLVEHLDRALLRRFDRVIEVPPPDKAARAGYLKKELAGRRFTGVSDQVIQRIAGRSAGMTIADLRRIINEAAVTAVRQNRPVDDELFEEVYERIRMGEASKAPDPATLERIARHEAGHALVGWAFGKLPVQVTIVGRGSAGGYVEREIDENKIIYTRRELTEMICQSMAGRAAELIYYGDEEGLSTGVGSDLRNATNWAERMIREFGMSEELGQVYLGSHAGSDGPLAERISSEAGRLVRQQLDCALELLTAHKEQLDALSAELLERNRITGEEMEALLGPAGAEA